MKNMNRILSMAAAVSLITTITTAVFAKDEPFLGPFNSETVTQSAVKSSFHSFSGTIKEINSLNISEDKPEEGMSFILVEDKDGGQANFFTNQLTYFITDDELEVGAEFMGFYDAGKPMLMIYPPQYTAVAVAVNLPANQSVKTDRFDKEFLSYDETLKLNISDETEIVLPDGEKYDGEIADRKLVVIYSVVTNSMPAQTAPVRVIVLYEEAVAPIAVLPEVELPTDESGVWTAEEMPIFVNGKEIESHKAYTKENGAVMVPIRAVAETLGFNVSWDSESNSVVLDNGITLSIGNDYYTYFRTAPIELGTAPELNNSTTFVPLTFFSKVARMGEAALTCGEIVINREASETSDDVISLAE